MLFTVAPLQKAGVKGLEEKPWQAAVLPAVLKLYMESKFSSSSIMWGRTQGGQHHV
jgi:hypothetical protein